jgi:opacity protein-like surface antigen
MKRILIVFTLAVLCIPSFTQTESAPATKLNEINFGYINVFNLSNSNLNIGLGYKRSGEMGATRLGTSFFFNAYNSGRTAGDEYSDGGFGITPRVGYEFHHDINRLRLYYGADLVSSVYMQKRENTSADGERFDYRKTEQYSLGLRPLVGLTFFLNPSISLSTEAGILFGWKMDRTSDADGLVLKDTYLNSSAGSLGTISVNIHF